MKWTCKEVLTEKTPSEDSRPEKAEPEIFSPPKEIQSTVFVEKAELSSHPVKEGRASPTTSSEMTPTSPVLRTEKALELCVHH